MSHAWYVGVGWSTVVVSVVGYAWRTIRRGRRLTPLVQPEERRWS